MAVVNFKGKFGSIAIYGSIGKPGMPDPAGINGVYKRRRTKYGIETIKMHFYRPSGTPNAEQIAQRAKMRTAVAAWLSLSADQKKAYNKLARNYPFSGYNLFLSRYMKTL
jgi:hypothetical protein